MGHIGTLDRLATEVLRRCLDDAKIAGFFLESEKGYEAVVRLCATTDTLDAQGKFLVERAVPVLTRELLEMALSRFRGTFQQTLPMYSAVKVKRLYELARAGQEVEHPSREVTVHALTLRDFSAAELALSVRCSKGFFVRVLASELGEALGCGAHLLALRRTRTGPFTLDAALSPERLRSLAETGPEAVLAQLVSIQEALSELPALEVPSGAVAGECPRRSGRLRAERPGASDGAVREASGDGGDRPRLAAPRPRPRPGLMKLPTRRFGDRAGGEGERRSPEGRDVLAGFIDDPKLIVSRGGRIWQEPVDLSRFQ